LRKKIKSKYIVYAITSSREHKIYKSVVFKRLMIIFTKIYELLLITEHKISIINNFVRNFWKKMKCLIKQKVKYDLIKYLKLIV
jgi:hypothetical protein